MNGLNECNCGLGCLCISCVEILRGGLWCKMCDGSVGLSVRGWLWVARFMALEERRGREGCIWLFLFLFFLCLYFFFFISFFFLFFFPYSSFFFFLAGQWHF